MEEPEAAVEAGPERVTRRLLRGSSAPSSPASMELDEHAQTSYCQNAWRRRGGVAKVVDFHGVDGGLDRGVELWKAHLDAGDRPGVLTVRGSREACNRRRGS